MSLKTLNSSFIGLKLKSNVRKGENAGYQRFFSTTMFLGYYFRSDIKSREALFHFRVS